MKNIEKIVNDVIKEESREEALMILGLSPKNEVDEFIKYYKEDNYNICCCHLDKLKWDLVKKDKMSYNKNDHFGHLYNDLEK